MDDIALRNELREIRNSIDAQSQGLTLLAEAVSTQSEMLRKILEAATKPPGENPLKEILGRIFTTLDTQTDAMIRLTPLLASMPGQVENAVARALQRASEHADADGVVEGDGHG